MLPKYYLKTMNIRPVLETNMQLTAPEGFTPAKRSTTINNIEFVSHIRYYALK